MGLEPIFNTLFSFKNSVDDFYIKFLEKDTILVDIFYIPKPSDRSKADKQQVSGAIKLGVAKLPLNKLIEKDYSFQAQEICPCFWHVAQTARAGKMLPVHIPQHLQFHIPFEGVPLGAGHLRIAQGREQGGGLPLRFCFRRRHVARGGVPIARGF